MDVIQKFKGHSQVFLLDNRHGMLMAGVCGSLNELQTFNVLKSLLSCRYRYLFIIYLFTLFFIVLAIIKPLSALLIMLRPQWIGHPLLGSWWSMMSRGLCYCVFGLERRIRVFGEFPSIGDHVSILGILLMVVMSLSLRLYKPQQPIGEHQGRLPKDKGKLSMSIADV